MPLLHALHPPMEARIHLGLPEAPLSPPQLERGRRFGGNIVRDADAYGLPEGRVERRDDIPDRDELRPPPDVPWPPAPAVMVTVRDHDDVPREKRVVDPHQGYGRVGSGQGEELGC